MLCAIARRGCTVETLKFGQPSILPCFSLNQRRKVQSFSRFSFLSCEVVMADLIESLVFRAAGLGLVSLTHHRCQICSSCAVWPGYVVSIAGSQR